MLRLAWANVVHRAARLLMPGLAVALGVGFVAGTLMVSDTMRVALLEQLSQTPATLSAVVERNANDLDGNARTVPAALLDQVAEVDGVAAAHGQLWGPIDATRSDGRKLTASPGRTVLIGIAQDERLRDITLVEGQAPSGATDLALDRATAESQRVRIGDQLRLAAAGAPAQTFTVTGLLDVSNRGTDFGDAAVVGTSDAVAGALLKATAYGRIETVAAAGVTPEQLRDRLVREFGDRYAVRTGEAVRAQEAREAIRDLDGFSTALLVFAGISVLVAGIVAYNTFSVVIAQRQRETALLRCVGATRRQVLIGALQESAVLGLLASLVGLLFGFGAAVVMLRIFDGSDGIDVTGTPVRLATSTVVVALILGPAAAMLAALVPTVRAARTRPIDALRDAAPAPIRSAGRRRRVAAVLAVPGAALLAGGVVVARTAEDPGRLPLVSVLIGALLLIGAVLTAAPLVIPRFGSLAGRAFGSIAGHPARLAGESVRRNPERTAVTAAALCIGLLLVTVVSTVAAAATTSVETTFAKNFPFAYTLRVEGSNPAAGPDLIDALSTRPEVGAVVAARGPSSATEATVDGKALRLRGVDDAVGDAAPAAVSEGSLRDFGAGRVALDGKLAEQLGVGVGDRFTARLAAGGDLPLTVVALLDAMSPLGPVAISNADLTRIAPQVPTSAIYLTRAAATSEPALRQAVNAVVADRPGVTPVSSAQSAKQFSDALDTLRTLLLSLLGLSVLISFFSVANTLSLSIIERARESALLRALGLTRAQLTRTLMAEGVFVVALGAGVGIVLGVALGWAVAAAMGWSLSAVLSVPVGRIGSFALLALLVGLVATVVPARRAGRIPITAALARE